MNNVKRTLSFLISKPGYLKTSKYEIANLLDVRPSDVEEAKIQYKELSTKINNDIKNNVINNSKPKKSPIITNDLKLSRPQIRGKKYLQPGLYISLGCVHAPFHLENAFKGVQQLLHDNKSQIVGLILAGDFLDLNSLSSHDKGKKPILGVTLDWEYSESENLLNDLLNPLSNNIEKIYIFGNHEDRYIRYMSDSDNSKLGSSLEGPISGLNLVKKGFDIYENWKDDYIMLGHHLQVSHGEFFNTHSAKKHIDTYRKSVLYYHTHRVQQYIEGSVGGYNGGSMADFNSPVFGYATRAMKNSWLNGFNTIHIDKEGYYHIQQIVCYNNSFVFGNKVYKY